MVLVTYGLLSPFLTGDAVRRPGHGFHDAHLAAAMMVHGQTAVLTFDKAGFARFRGLQVVHPGETFPPTAPTPS